MKKPNLHTAAFSIIEMMIGIFIFTLGLLSVYMLLMSSLGANEYNKNAIIASNLALEQVEIFRNIRDTNYKNLKVFHQQNPEEAYTSTTRVFSTGSYYTLENDFSNPSNFVKITNITPGFEQGVDKISGNSMKSYQLCLSSQGQYTYCNNVAGEKKLPFFRYLYLQELRDTDNTIIPNAFLVTSQVIWYIKGYHEYNIKTIVTDWRRI